MLTHNAPEFVELSVRSVREKTVGVNYELIVLDNASGEATTGLVKRLHQEGKIDKLRLLEYNSLFAEGNNIAASLASPDSTHFLLLNSDIEIKKSDWLSNLLLKHKRGITSYGIVADPQRVDGYCLLIDRDLYEKIPLDQGHQWWWAVTKQQATLLQQDYSVQRYQSHEEWIHHFGGKSGDSYKHALGMNVTREEAYGWFNGKMATILN